MCTPPTLLIRILSKGTQAIIGTRTSKICVGEERDRTPIMHIS